MSPIKSLFSPPRSRAAFVMAVAASLGVAAGGSHAADGQAVDAAVEVAAARLAVPACGKGRFAVATANGGTRTMEICGGDGRDPSATARALSLAIDAGASDSAIHADARMPELLSLRLMRARTHVDTSLPPNERLRRLAAIEVEIKSLEIEILKSEALDRPIKH